MAAKSRKKYYMVLWKYEERRKVYKRKFKETGAEKYRTFYRRITVRICYLKDAIRRIDKRYAKIKFLLKHVNRYFSVDIHSRRMDTQHKLARSIYYKIGMESKLRGCWLARFIGRSDRSGQTGRLSFTRSFTTKPQNKESFYNFKKYFEDEIKRSRETTK